MSFLRSKKIISVIITMLMTLAFSITMAGVVAQKERDTFAWKNTYQIRVAFIDVDGAPREVHFNVGNNDGGWFSSTAKSRMKISDMMAYARGSLTEGNNLPSGGDFGLTRVGADASAFKTAFKKWNITHLYCYDGDDEAVQGKVYSANDYIYFDSWTTVTSTKAYVSVGFTDELGVTWTAGKDGNTLTRGSFGGIDNNNGYIRATTTPAGELTAGQVFQRFRDNVNKTGMTYKGCQIYLCEDLKLAEVESNWTPIGYVKNNGTDWTNHAFAGSFNGLNHTISNFKFNYTHATSGNFWDVNDKNQRYDDKEEAIGLFGRINGASIRNLLIKDADVYAGGSTIYGRTVYAFITDAVGILVGAAGGGSTIENCQVLNSKLTAWDEGETGSQYAGGLVGLAYGNVTIKNCSVQADISVRCNFNNFGIDVGVGAGGIFGLCFHKDQSTLKNIRVKIDNCYYVGTIVAEDQTANPDRDWVHFVSVGGIASGMSLFLSSSIVDVPDYDWINEKFKNAGEVKALVTINNCFSYLMEGTKVCPATRWEIDNNRDSNMKLRAPDYNPNDNDSWLRGAPLDAILGPTYWDPAKLYNNCIIQGGTVSNSKGYLASGVEPGKIKLYTTNKTEAGDRETINKDPDGNWILMTTTEIDEDNNKSSLLYAEQFQENNVSGKKPGDFYTSSVNWGQSISCIATGAKDANGKAISGNDSLWYLPRIGGMYYGTNFYGKLDNNTKNDNPESVYYGLPIIRDFVDFAAYEAVEGTGTLKTYKHKDMLIATKSGDKYTIVEGECGVNAKSYLNGMKSFKENDVANILAAGYVIFLKTASSEYTDLLGGTKIDLRHEKANIPVADGSAVFQDTQSPYLFNTLLMPDDAKSSEFGKLEVSGEVFYGYTLYSQPDVANSYTEPVTWKRNGNSIISTYTNDPPDLDFSIYDATLDNNIADMVGFDLPGIWNYDVDLGKNQGVKLTTNDSSQNELTYKQVLDKTATSIKYANAPTMEQSGSAVNKLKFNKKQATFTYAVYDKNDGDFTNYTSVTVTCTVPTNSIFEFVRWGVYVRSFDTNGNEVISEVPEYVLDDGEIKITSNYIIKAIIRLKMGAVEFLGDDIDGVDDFGSTNSNYTYNTDKLYLKLYEPQSKKTISIQKMTGCDGWQTLLPVGTIISPLDNNEGFKVKLPFEITIKVDSTKFTTSDEFDIRRIINIGYESADYPYAYRSPKSNAQSNGNYWSKLESEISLTQTSADNPCQLLYAVNAIPYDIEFNWDAKDDLNDYGGSFTVSYTIKDGINFENDGLTQKSIALDKTNPEVVTNYVTRIQEVLDKKATDNGTTPLDILQWITSSRKSFSSWYIRLNTKESYSPGVTYSLLEKGEEGYIVSDYKVKVENAEAHITNPSKEIITLDLNNIDSYFTDLDGYVCLNIDSVITGSYGNLIGVLNLKWANTYDVAISVGTSVWSSYTDEEFKRGVYGVRAFNGTNDTGLPYITYVDDTYNEITMKIADSSNTPQYPFYFNEGYAFMRAGNPLGDKVDSTFGELSPNVQENGKEVGGKEIYYAVYNYGYEIEGWYISFSYNNNTYWLVLTEQAVVDNDGNLTGEYRHVWTRIQSDDTATNIYTNFKDLKNLELDTYSIIHYAKNLDDWFTSLDGVQKCDIKMWPKWKAASVDVVEKTSGTSTNNIVSINYGGDFRIDSNSTKLKGREVNKTVTYLQVLDDSSSVTENIIYLAEDDGSYAYLYTTIPGKCYIYSDGVYKIYTKIYNTCNINKVNIGNVLADDKYTLNGYVDAVFSYTDSEYNVFSTYMNTAIKKQSSYRTEHDNSVPVCDKYAEYLKDYVSDYNDYITGPSNADDTFGILRKLYKTSNTQYHIYLAEGQEVGVLPEFTRMYHTHVATATTSKSTQNIPTLNAYLTSQYDETKHSHIMEYATGKKYKTTNKWSYSYHEQDHVYGDTYQIDLKWYRKSYKYNVNITEDGDIGKYGYVLMKIEDTLPEQYRNATFYYLIIDIKDDGDMEYYRLNTKPTGSIGALELPEAVSEIIVEAGSDVTFEIFDQHNAVGIESDDSLDSLIGHRYLGFKMNYGEDYETTLNKDEFTHTYDTEMFETEWQVKDNSIVNVSVEFEKIVYDFFIRLDNYDAGHIKIKSSTINQNNAKYIRVTNVKVGDSFTITYNAEPGYEFKSDAIVFYVDGNKRVSAITYESLKAKTSDQQSYRLVIDAQWLRNNFYNVTEKEAYSGDNSYATDDVRLVGEKENISDYGLGKLQIETTLINFHVCARMYNNKNEIDAGHNLLHTAWTLDSKTIDLTSIFDDFSGIGIGPYGYISKIDNPGTKYAIVESYAFDAINGTNNNLNTVYKYPMEQIPNGISSIDITPYLETMLNAGGNIIPDANRKLYIIVELKEIMDLTVTIERDERDTQVSQPSISLTAVNEEQNSIDVEIKAPASENITKTIQCYEGLGFDLKTWYDSLHYQDVEMVYNGNPLKSNTITVDKNNSQLIVKFTPRQLTAKYAFYNNDKKLTGDSFDAVKEELSNILTAFEITDETQSAQKYYMGDKLTFKYAINALYNISIEINSGRSFETLDCSGGSATYEISALTYTNGGLNINVRLKERDHSIVKVSYYLSGSVNSEDTYGDMSANVYYEGSSYSYNYDDLTVDGIKVVDKSEVEITFDVVYGYKIVKYQLNNNDPVTITQSSGRNIELTEKRLIINSYNKDTDGGTYRIILEKINYKVTFEKDDKTYANHYNIYRNDHQITKTDGIARMSDLQVGQKLEFKIEQGYEERETLDKYYYIIGTEEISIGNKGDYNVALDINSDFLKNYFESKQGSDTIEFYVKSSPKFTVSVQFTRNADKLVTFKSSKDLTSGASMVYFDVGVELTLTFLSKVPDKYTITVTGLSDSNAVGTSIEAEIVMNRNYAITVDAEVNKYDFIVEEYLYEKLEDLNNGGQKQSTDTQEINYANGTGEMSYYYEKNMTRLTSIVITGNDLPDIELKIEKDSYSIIFDGDNFGSENEKYTVTKTDDGFKIDRCTLDEKGEIVEITLSTTYTISRDDAGGFMISYNIFNDATMKVYYTSLKVISGQLEEKGE